MPYTGAAPEAELVVSVLPLDAVPLDDDVPLDDEVSVEPLDDVVEADGEDVSEDDVLMSAPW